jgi:tetratricopeptide (TPR) repeat protein
LKDFQNAKLNINLFLKQNPHSHEGLYQKALIHYEINHLKLALSDINEALKIHTKSSEYYVLSGKIRLRLKSKVSACNDFLKALNLNSDFIYLYDDNCSSTKQ